MGRPAFEANPARRTVKPALVIVKIRFWLPGRFLSRRLPGWSRKGAVLKGDRGFESISLQRRVCEPSVPLCGGVAILRREVTTLNVGVPLRRWTREACYLGWQESLRNLARLVEPEINQ